MKRKYVASASAGSVVFIGALIITLRPFMSILGGRERSLGVLCALWQILT